MLDKVKILILAGGKGTRMQNNLPKALIPVNGKPIIKHLLESIKNSGIDAKPVIVVGYGKEDVMAELGSEYEYVIQEKQLGTGHAVITAENALKHKADHIVVLYCDHPFVSKKTIQELVRKHLDSKVKITLATVTLPDFQDWRKIFYTNFSRIIRDEKGHIVRDIQFKDATEEDKKNTEVNPCYFCFESKWLWENLKTLNTNNAQKEYYLTDLVKIAEKEKERIESIQIDPHEALGVNSKEELEILEKLATK